jgi:hypothetical protein
LSEDGFKEYSLEDFEQIVMPERQLIEAHVDLPYETNRWLRRNFIVYGDIGALKTETIRLFAEWAAVRYSPEDLSAFLITRGRILQFLDCPMLAAKPIQILFLDDMTGIDRLSRIQADNWFRMRHVAKNITHLPVGLVLTFLGTHEYYALPKRMRQGVTGFMAKSAPTNPFDERLVRKWVGDEGMEVLNRQTTDRLLFLPHDEVTVFRIHNFIGYIKTPFASANYLREWAWSGPAIKQKQVAR